MNVLLVLAFVALVNGACMFSFSRAEKALRELGAAWVRALAAPRVETPPRAEPEPPPPGATLVAHTAARRRAPQLARV